VEDSELRRSRRLLGLSLIILEPPLPPLRQKLDHQGSFEATGDFEPEKPPEESTANLGLVETSSNDTWSDIIVPIQFCESLSVPNLVMEQITSFGNSSIPITVTTTGESSLNLPLSAVRATMVSAATTSHCGLTPSIVAATPPYTPSATGAPFSYGMPSSGTSPTLTSSTLQIWVWGQGALTLLCKFKLGALLSLSMIFLMLGVISLLHHLCLLDCISSPLGRLHTRVHLELGVKEHLRKLCR
jgi:hypothetical protein